VAPGQPDVACGHQIAKTIEVVLRSRGGRRIGEAGSLATEWSAANTAFPELPTVP
jgi:hypothetical protein